MKIKYWAINWILIAASFLGIYYITGYYKNNENIIHSDVVEYYSYLPALFVYNDLKMRFLDNNAEELKNKVRANKLQNGNYAVKMSMGMSLMYAPFYLLAHAYAKLFSYPADGFSLPFSTALAFGSLLYYLIGIYVLGKCLAQHFEDSVVAIVLFLLSFATNATYYLVREPAMSHTYSFLLFSLFIFLTIRWHANQKIIYAMMLGFLIGIITLVRPTNAIIIILLFLWKVSCVDDFTHNVKLFLSHPLQIIIFSFSCFLVWVPQIVYWYKVTGKIFFYSYIDENFFFLNPQILEVLFGFRKGWLLYTPVMLFAIIGFGVMYKNRKELFWSMTIFMIFNVYIISSWWCWWYGGSYGHRAFIESYSVMAFPLAALIQSLSKAAIGKVLVSCICVFVICHNFLQIVKLKTGALSYESMTKEAYFEVLDKIRPTQRYYELLESPDFERARMGLPERPENER